MTPKRTPPTKRKPKSRRPTTPRKVLVRWVNLYRSDDGEVNDGGVVWDTWRDARHSMPYGRFATVRIEIPVEGV